MTQENYNSFEINKTQDMNIELPEFRKIKYEFREKYLNLSETEREYVEEAINHKLETIINNELWIKAQIYNVIKHIQDDLEVNIIEREVINIDTDIQTNLQIAYELPDISFLHKKVNDYLNFFRSIKKVFYDYGMKIELYYQYFNNFEKYINFWNEVSLYIQNSLIRENQCFNKPIFNFDFYFIDYFFKIIKKSHIDEYVLFLKHQFAISGGNMDYISFDIRLNNIRDYYKNYKNERKVFSSDNIMKITYDTFVQMGLVSNYEEFIKAYKNNKTTLKFSKNESETKSYNYEIGFIFYKLKQFEFIDNQVKNVTFKIDSQKYNIDNLINIAKTNLSKSRKNIDLNFVKTNSELLKKWQNEILIFYIFRDSSEFL